MLIDLLPTVQSTENAALWSLPSTCPIRSIILYIRGVSNRSFSFLSDALSRGLPSETNSPLLLYHTHTWTDLAQHLRQLRILNGGGDDDDDVLGESMRSLRLQSPSSGGDPRTPSSNHRSGNLYGMFYTPDSTTSNRSVRGGLPAASGSAAYASPLTGSMLAGIGSSRNGAPRRMQSQSASMLTTEQVRQRHEREMRKRRVGRKLAEVLSKIGPRVRVVEE